MSAPQSPRERDALRQGHTERVPRTRAMGSAAPAAAAVPEPPQAGAALAQAVDDRLPAAAHLQHLLDMLPILASCHLPDGSTAFCNQRWHDYTGLSPEEAHGWGWHGTLHPDDLGRVRDTWHTRLAAGEPGEIEARWRRGDGAYRWFRFQVVPRRDELGHIVHWYATSSDIEDRKRTEAALRWSEALLAGEKRVLEMIATGEALPRILEALCRVVEEQASDMLSSCLLLDAHGTHLRHGAAPRLPQRYIDAIDGVAIGPSGGSCITAAYRAAPVVVSDIATDPLWAAYRHLPLAHGLRACWSTPILSAEGTVLGTFAMYYREPRSPSPHDLYVLEQVASVAAVAIMHQRAEERLRQDEQELRRIIDAIPQTIVVLGSDGRTLYANQAMLAYTGLTLDEVLAVDFRARVFHPDDVEKLHDDRQEALARGLPFANEQRARRHDGQYRWFLIQYNPLRDDQGRLLRWYATGTDIDERKQAEERMRHENLVLREDIARASMFEEIVGSSAALRRVLAHVEKVAGTDATVLIVGETGTGKELIARAIHKRSHRATRAFIRVNCAAIPPALIASELFGHEKGAFTGALQRRLGRFEAAHGGTIFLDEIGDLPAETQIALLRVLQERELERVGSSHPIAVDVRVLAATNRDLQAAVAAGTFRQDLFYRLHVFPIQLPSLRERVDDIPLLVAYLIERYAKKAGKKIRTINKQTLALFQAYDWPGNIRELQNVIERAVILCESDTFAVEERWLQREAPPRSGPAMPLVAARAEHERELIEAALSECRGRVSGPAGAAAKLGLPRQTLESKIKALGIPLQRFKTRQGD
jgi:PAS domain S-box-containing protein